MYPYALRLLPLHPLHMTQSEFVNRAESATDRAPRPTGSCFSSRFCGPFLIKIPSPSLVPSVVLTGLMTLIPQSPLMVKMRCPVSSLLALCIVLLPCMEWLSMGSCALMYLRVWWLMLPPPRRAARIDIPGTGMAQLGWLAWNIIALKYKCNLWFPQSIMFF